MSEIAKLHLENIVAENEHEYLVRRNGFVQTPTFDLLQERVKRFIIGRKGSGKSAHRLALIELGSIVKDISDEILLTDFDPGIFFTYLDSIEARFPGISRVKLIRNFWRFTVSVRLMCLLRDSGRVIPQYTNDPVLGPKFFHVRDYLEKVGFGPEMKGYPTLLTCIEHMQAKADESLEHTRIDEFLIHNKISDASEHFPTDENFKFAEEALEELLGSGDGALIVIDDLDCWIERSTYEQMLPFIEGLLFSIMELSDRHLSKAKLKLKVFLPDDLFRKVTFRHMDKIKPSCEWFVWDAELLKELVARHISIDLGIRCDFTRKEHVDNAFARIFPGWPTKFLVKDPWENLRDPIAYILFFTHYRPRDVLYTLKAIQDVWKERHRPQELLRTEDVIEGCWRACTQHQRSIVDEFGQRFPYLDRLIQGFVRTRAALEWEPLVEIVADRIEMLGLTSELSPEQAIEDLYEIGFIGKFTNPNQVYPERGPVVLGSESDYVLYSFAKARTDIGRGDVLMIHPVFWGRLELKRPKELCRGVVDPYIVRQVTV